MRKICLNKYSTRIYDYDYVLHSIFDINDTFDLIIINNVLSAFPENEIYEVLKKICQIGKYVYIRENKLSDGISWFNHDFDSMLINEKYIQKNSEYILYNSW